MYLKDNSKIFIIILIAVIINIFISNYNISNYDKYRTLSNGKNVNSLISSDIYAIWRKSDQFVKKIREKEGVINSLPTYDRSFLPSILVGLYYLVINDDIFEKSKENSENQSYKFKILKKNNYKIGFLIIQILIFYFSLFYFCQKLKKHINEKNLTIIAFFLAFEPTLIQWHSSFWSESIFLSLNLILMAKVIEFRQSFIQNLTIGLLLGLLFAQRAASVFLFIPFIIFFIIIYKKNIKPIAYLLVGYLSVILLIGSLHYFKKGVFFVLPFHSNQYSNYHYMYDDIFAKANKISKDQSYKLKIEKEEKWRKINFIQEDEFKDKFKIIKYRNNEFIKLVIKHPITSFKYLMYKSFQASILDPFYVQKSYNLDKSIKDYHKNLNKDLKIRIIYSSIFYILCFLGLLSLFNKIFFIKKINNYYYFLILNILIIFYYIIFTGGYGVSRYFSPLLINYVFFFNMGLEFLNKKKL